ncbi:MAG: iron-sulfur cluster repair di-iron protein [Clostridiales bacterium]|nr:iron-sulfur cluster repair di-iron protein [Clostridiales bacterium]
MAKFESTQHIGDIVANFPKASQVFMEYRIDFCCGGNRPLKEAIQEQQLDETEVIDKLNNLYKSYSEEIALKEENWLEADLDVLVDHIVNKHHGFLWRELPNISQLTTKILRVHGAHHPELAKVNRLFHMIKMELEEHLTKEETLQYPAIKKYLESNSKEDLSEAVRIINELEEEHTAAGNILKELRVVTKDYAIPDDVCATYVLTYEMLQTLEEDLFQHIHLENNILFPRLFAINNK